MEPMYSIGLDVHKQKISYCVKDSSGRLFVEGWIPATRHDLDSLGGGGEWPRLIPLTSETCAGRTCEGLESRPLARATGIRTANRRDSHSIRGGGLKRLTE